MSEATIDNLFELIEPKIEKQGPMMGKAIPASQKRSITFHPTISGIDLEEMNTSAIASYTLDQIII